MVLLSKDKTHSSLIQQAMIIPLCHKRKASPTSKTKNWRKKKKCICLPSICKKGNELMLANLDVYTSLLFSLIFERKKKKHFFMPRCHNNIYFSISPLNTSTLTFFYIHFMKFICSSLSILYTIYYHCYCHCHHHPIFLTSLLSPSPPPSFNAIVVTTTTTNNIMISYHHHKQVIVITIVIKALILYPLFIYVFKKP